jgi:hypothetical protein
VLSLKIVVANSGGMAGISGKFVCGGNAGYN